MSTIRSFFSNSGFMPHIHCYLAQPNLVWSMVITDLLIGVSYVAISTTLYSLMRKAKMPFHSVFLAFGVFILACGGTHFMEIYNLWVPNYWLAVFIKAITASASLATAGYLIVLYPQIIIGMEAAKEIAQTKISVEAYFKTKLTTPVEMKRLLARTAIIPVLLAAGLATISVIQALHIRSTQFLVAHSDQVMLTANDLHLAFVEADSNLRGFWLTGDKKLLVSMKTAQEKYLNKQSALKELISNDFRQIKSLQEKEALFNRWQKYSVRGIAHQTISNRQFDLLYKEGEGIRKGHQKLFQKMIDVEEYQRAKRAVRASQAFLFFLISTVALALAVGGVFATIGRSALKQISLSYRLSLEKLHEAISFRDEFIAIASHELKTPITSLKLQLELTKREIIPEKNIVPSPERLKKLIDVSSTQVDRMTVLVDELLDVSRIDAGKLKLHIEAINLSELINEVIERLSMLSKIENAPIVFEPMGPLMVWGDRFRLDQVFMNLISNAIKYGSTKPIKILSSISSDHKKISIDVCDQGVGISKEEQSKIFIRFERAIGAEKMTGFGLGLYIAQQIVIAHEGELTVESEIGKGSTFTTVLPSTAGPKTRSS